MQPKHSATITLPGGLKADAVWWDDCQEGNVFVDAEWARNTDDRAKQTAKQRAADASGRDDLDWLLITDWWPQQNPVKMVDDWQD